MLKFKNIQIDSPLLLAPLAGYTDMPFRIICRELGAGMVFSELISADGIIRKNQKTLDLMRISSKEQPVAIQIFGNDPQVMGDAAVIVEKLGPAIIDINMGCCAQRVCRSGSGAALLKNTEHLYKIAANVKKNVSIPVTAKIRIGWDEKNKNYLDTVQALNEAGMAFISVHGRTKIQQYSGYADWEIIKEVSHFSKTPIIGNGDVLSYDDAILKLKESGCAAVMLGRAALGNPWIFNNKIPEQSEIIEIIKRHLNMMIDHYEEKGIILMRKHIVKYIHDFKDASHIRRKLVIAKSQSEILKLLAQIPC